MKSFALKAKIPGGWYVIKNYYDPEWIKKEVEAGRINSKEEIFYVEKKHAVNQELEYFVNIDWSKDGFYFCVGHKSFDDLLLEKTLNNLDEALMLAEYSMEIINSNFLNKEAIQKELATL